MSTKNYMEDMQNIINCLANLEDASAKLILACDALPRTTDNYKDVADVRKNTADICLYVREVVNFICGMMLGKL